jgi:hypothetical protein
LAEDVDELLELNAGIAVFVELAHDAVDVCLLELDVELPEDDADLLFVDGAVAVLVEEVEGSFETGQLLLV